MKDLKLLQKDWKNALLSKNLFWKETRLERVVNSSEELLLQAQQSQRLTLVWIQKKLFQVKNDISKDCEIENEGAKGIAELLKGNSSLTSLDLQRITEIKWQAK